jgi:hypothetical protein
MTDGWNSMIILCIIILIISTQAFLESSTKFHYITVATKPHPVLTKIQDNCHSNGEEVIVLGLKENRDIGWKAGANFGIKLREVFQYLQKPELGANDIVLFSDAYDVAIIGCQAEIQKRFKRHFQKPIVFGAELGCHPDKDREPMYGSTFGLEFPFLNSGLFIGRVWALRRCFSGYKYKDAEDDQRFWTSQYFKHRELIELDHHAKLFLNCAYTDQKDIEWDSYKRRLTYSKTQTHPLLIHANGDEKSYLYQIIGRYTEPTKSS